jgi:hypothetical protein
MVYNQYGDSSGSEVGLTKATTGLAIAPATATLALLADTSKFSITWDTVTDASPDNGGESITGYKVEF